MRILEKGNSNTKSLSYTSLVLSILEYGAACLEPYRKEQIGVNALGRVQNKAAKFAHHRNDSYWETLTQRRKIVLICAVFETCTVEGGYVIDYKDYAIWAESIIIRE
jgi:hypothetical protein